MGAQVDFDDLPVLASMARWWNEHHPDRSVREVFVIGWRPRLTLPVLALSGPGSDESPAPLLLGPLADVP